MMKQIEREQTLFRPVGRMMNRYRTFFCLFFAALVFPVWISTAQPPIKERNILVNEAEAVNLREALAANDAWAHLPDYYDRAFWNSLPESMKSTYIRRAEEHLDFTWPTFKATDFLEFIRSGDRLYSTCGSALIALVMGELVEGKGRFIDQIINGVWHFSERTWWGWTAHLGPQKAGAGLPDVNEPYVDLGVGEEASNLCWTLHLFKKEFDKAHPLIAQRLKQEILHKVLNPYFERDDFWYMGFKGGHPNNWNPWINYNMLTSYLLIVDEPEHRAETVHKVLRSIDKFLNAYPDDGGCDEGPSYWGAAGAYLYESLEVMGYATGGLFDVYDNQLVKNIGKYFYEVNIHAPYFINFADADAETGGSPSVVYRYGKAINDPVMQKFGAYLANLNRWGDSALGGKIGGQIRDLKMLNEIRTAPKEEALVADFWYPNTEIAGGRDRKGSFNGFFFGAKGGFNAESHNHNDIGSCLMYFDGKPCLVDAGRETYVAKTFSSRRYEIWTMQSGYHNLPVINGVDQKDGAKYKARNSSFKANSGTVTFSTDIAGSYPEEAGVKSWVRTYTLKRGNRFEIKDHYQLNEVTGQPTSSNLLTACKVSITKPGVLRFEGDGFVLNMSYDASLFKPEIEPLSLTDKLLKRYWPDGLIRIKMIMQQPKLSGSYSFRFTKAK